MVVEGGAMARVESNVSNIIMSQILNGTDVEAHEAGPAVISCGGMYIPHKGSRQEILYHIITTHRNDEPVKVVTGQPRKNILHAVIEKESMN
jgi:hypothetical protein